MNMMKEVFSKNKPRFNLYEYKHPQQRMYEIVLVCAPLELRWNQSQVSVAACLEALETVTVASRNVLLFRSCFHNPQKLIEPSSCDSD